MTGKITQLRELLAKATPGPWESTWDEEGAPLIIAQCWVCETADEADAQLIAAVVNALPELLDELERLLELEEESRQPGMDLDLLTWDLLT